MTVVATSRTDVARSRRTLVTEGTAIGVTVGAYGLAFGVAAGATGLTLAEAVLMSGLVFAGAAQFSALGPITLGAPVLAIVVVTAIVNARNALYAATLAPWLSDTPARRRMAMAHFLSDATFALSLAHFRRTGIADTWGYWWVAIIGTFAPWMAGTVAGMAIGMTLPDPASVGLDVVFPAVMAGTAVGLVEDRLSAVSLGVGCVAAVGMSLVVGPVAGVGIGALAGALVAMLADDRTGEEAPG